MTNSLDVNKFDACPYMHIVRSYGSSAWVTEIKRNSTKIEVARVTPNLFIGIIIFPLLLNNANGIG